MSHIPTELWQIIMNKLDTKNQITIKQLCKYLYSYTIIQYDDNYIDSIGDKIPYCINYNYEIDYVDVMKYLFEKNGCSQTKLLKIIEEIAEKKRYKLWNCVHTLVDGKGADDIRCVICNYNYDCEECEKMFENNIKVEESRFLKDFEYIKWECDKCNQKVWVLNCKYCYESYNECQHIY